MRVRGATGNQGVKGFMLKVTLKLSPKVLKVCAKGSKGNKVQAQIKVIRQRAKGNTGPQGNQGNQGVQGPQGATFNRQQVIQVI